MGRRGMFVMAALAAVSLPPPDSGDISSYLFQRFVDLLAGVSRPTWQALLKINVSAGTACGLCLWAWWNGMRVKGVLAGIFILGAFAGLATPVGFIEVTQKLPRASIVLVLAMLLVCWVFIIPFIFEPSSRRQFKWRLAVASVLAVVFTLNVLLKGVYGH